MSKRYVHYVDCGDGFTDTYIKIYWNAHKLCEVYCMSIINLPNFYKEQCNGIAYLDGG